MKRTASIACAVACAVAVCVGWQSPRPAGAAGRVADVFRLFAPSLFAPLPLVVDSTGDAPDLSPGDGLCQTATAVCTLRAAIEEANAAADADTINFLIVGVGAQTISPATPLPTIVNPVTIDGYTQPGSSQNTLAVG